MTWELTATITHKSFGMPIVHKFYYSGNTIEDVLAQIETLPQHIHNLRKHRRAAFKDQRGVKHSWRLVEIKDTTH